MSDFEEQFRRSVAAQESSRDELGKFSGKKISSQKYSVWNHPARWNPATNRFEVPESRATTTIRHYLTLDELRLRLLLVPVEERMVLFKKLIPELAPVNQSAALQILRSLDEV